MPPSPRFTTYRGLERRRRSFSAPMLCASAAGVAAIAFATLCPIGLRPHLASADQERFGAYFVLGAMLALAAPRKGLMVSAFVAALAFCLEAGQLLVPGRDAVLHDAVVKAVGGLLGARFGYAGFAVRRRLRRHGLFVAPGAGPAPSPNASAAPGAAQP